MTLRLLPWHHSTFSFHMLFSSPLHTSFFQIGTLALSSFIRYSAHQIASRLWGKLHPTTMLANPTKQSPRTWAATSLFMPGCAALACRQMAHSSRIAMGVYPSYWRFVTVLSSKLSHVIPTKTNTAPHPGGDDNRKSCTYLSVGRVSDTWLRREEEEEDSSSAMLVR